MTLPSGDPNKWRSDPHVTICGQITSRRHLWLDNILVYKYLVYEKVIIELKNH